MKRKLTMDDIRPGMFITVVRGKVEQRAFPGPNGPEIQCREKDNLNGKVLEVLVVDMPYAVVKIHDRRVPRRDAIDLRQVELQSLDLKYIEALFPDMEINKDKYFDGFQQDNSLENAGTNIEEIFKDL